MKQPCHVWCQRDCVRRLTIWRNYTSVTQRVKLLESTAFGAKSSILGSATCTSRTGRMAVTLLSSLSVEDVTNFFNSIDTVLTDCDGVLWLDKEAIGGAAAAVDLLREMGKKIFYVTNNSTKTRDEFVEKCQQLGFKATKDEILSTSYLTACYLSDKGFKGKVYVVGSKGITQELDAVGIQHTEVGPDNLNTGLWEFIPQFKRDPEVTAVVVGFDEHYSYVKMLKAASYVEDPNCLFIATNTDERFPTSTDLVVPGSGSILAGIEACAGRQAFRIGKPSLYLRDALSTHHKLDPKRTLMIGDRGNTDIILGTRCGFQTLLVLTGVTSLGDVREWQASDNKDLKDCVPDYYLNSLGDLIVLAQGKVPCGCKK